MPSRRVTAELNAGTYYLTLTVQRWYYRPRGTGFVTPSQTFDTVIIFK